MVGNAVRRVWSSATSMVTNEIPIIASSDSRNGRTCPLEWCGSMDGHFVGATFDESNNFKILARRVIRLATVKLAQTAKEKDGTDFNHPATTLSQEDRDALWREAVLESPSRR